MLTTTQAAKVLDLSPKGLAMTDQRLAAEAADFRERDLEAAVSALVSALRRYVEDDDIGARLSLPRYKEARAAIARAEQC